MTSRIERWERYGQVKVTRDKKGHFIHWEKLISVVSELMKGKAVAVYGTCKTKYGTKSRRFEFVGGNGRELYDCIAWAIHHPPRKRFVKVQTGSFIANPFKYSTGGYWLDYRVES